MLKCSLNGFLNMLGSLVALCTVSEVSWHTVLHDVTWVLECTIAAKEAPRYVLYPLVLLLN